MEQVVKYTKGKGDSHKTANAKNYLRAHTVDVLEVIATLNHIESDTYKLDVIKALKLKDVKGLEYHWLLVLQTVRSDTYINDALKHIKKIGCINPKDSVKYVEDVHSILEILRADTYKCDAIKICFSGIDVDIICEQAKKLLGTLHADCYIVDGAKTLKSHIIDKDEVGIIARLARAPIYVSELKKLFWTSPKRRPHKKAKVSSSSSSSSDESSSGDDFGSITIDWGSGSGGIYIFNSSVIGNCMIQNNRKNFDFTVRGNCVIVDGKSYSGGRLTYNDFIFNTSNDLVKVIDKKDRTLPLKNGSYKTKDGEIYYSDGKPVYEAPKVPNVSLPTEITEKDVEEEDKEYDGKEDSKSEVDTEEGCKICMDRKCSAIILPCAHKDLCRKCAFEAKNKNSCHFCRGKVSNALKTF